MALNSTEADSNTQSDSQSAGGNESFRNSSDRGDTQTEEEDDQGNKMTLKWIRDELKRDWKTYYRTPELNEKLYFHHKGKIEFQKPFPEKSSEARTKITNHKLIFYRFCQAQTHVNVSRFEVLILRSKWMRRDIGP